MTTPLVEVRDLSVSFRMDKGVLQPAVRNVSFDIPAESTVALVGESGSGKSVSAMSLVRLLPENAVIPPESQVRYAGQNVLAMEPAALRKLRGKEISVVFQDPMSSLNPVFTVANQIGELLQLHEGLSKRQARERTLELLNEVGLPNAKQRLDAYPHELSGGQQQRVMIAMAVACNPRLLIADEPTTALDVTVQRQIIDLLARLQQSHRMAMLFISHDLGLVGEIAQHVVVMRHGQVRESRPAAELFAHPEDDYTKALLACRPRLDVRPRRLPVIDDYLQHRTIDTAPRAGAPDDGPVLIEAAGLAKQYKLRDGFLRWRTLDAVKGADFVLRRGRTLGVVGESGSGKTTMGMMLARVTDPSGGRILFEGQDLAALSASDMQPFRRRIQVIFQNPYASLNPRFTVGQIVMEPMKIHGIGASDAERQKLAMDWLDKVGLPATAFHKYPHEFSGGQRQRIAIARCLTMRPEIIVCDEIVSALDVSVQATVLNLLLDLQEEFGLSYIFISHDLAVVRYIADDILVMNQGEVVECGTSEAIYAAPQHPYTQKLLAAIPRGPAATAPVPETA